MKLSLQVEVAGCPTVCKHCWAQGLPYGAMPVDDIARVLDLVGNAAEERGYEFGAYPMHEVAAHPDAPAVLSLFRERFDDKFHPLPTTGVPLFMREDWREFIPALCEAGDVRTFAFAFHGVGTKHDWLVGRDGAFEESCEAVRRVRQLGYGAVTSVLVTRDLLERFDEAVAVLTGLGFGQRGNGMAWEPATYYPIPRQRAYETQRPNLDELRPRAVEIAALSFHAREKWACLEDHTEAAWYERAISDAWPRMSPAGDRGEKLLVCRPDFDLQTGLAGVYGPRHGNLRDDPRTTIETALAAPNLSGTQLYLRREVLPPAADLARDVGDPGGEAVHFHAFSIYNYWAHKASGRVGVALRRR